MAVAHFKEVLRLKADSVDILNELAWLLAVYNQAEFHNSEDAIRLAKRANELTKYENPVVLDTLSVAYASAGRFTVAIAIAEKAIAAAQAPGQEKFAEKVRNRLRLYKAGKPYVEQTAKTASD